MHAPDGLLNAGTALATGAFSVGAVGASVRQARHHLQDKQVPLAGVAAAFIFAAQMFNFPVAAGTTGHLLGGALAAVLLGPSTGVVVVTVVVVVQALVFADGGLTALGYNIANIAVVPAFAGYALFRMFRRVMPVSTGGVVAATGLAAWASVVLASMAFSIEWLFGATVPVSFDTVFAAMTGIHVVTGIGEGIISALVLGAVLSTRPDLVHGAADLDRTQLASREPVMRRTFVLGAVVASLFVAAVVSQFAFPGPDGLQRVAQDTGIPSVQAGTSLTGPFAGYATAGVANPSLSLAVAGIAGTAITIAVGLGAFHAVRERRRGTDQDPVP